MTGITRVSKESIFSDLNNLVVVTAISDAYADCFGFTEEEVWAALREFGLYGEKRAGKKELVKKRYAAVLEAKGIVPERIRRYGFAFEGKKVLIG